MNTLIFVTGASGSGKTATLELLEKQDASTIKFCYFDSVGVPSMEEMIERYGSGDGWQKATTDHWVKKIASEYLPHSSVILDGQIRLSFINDICNANNITDYKIILFDCTDTVRTERLKKRGHAELASEDMINWARYLRTEAQADKNAIVYDTSELTIEQAVKDFAALLRTNK